MDEDSIFPVVCRKRLANIIRSSPSPSHASIRWSLGLHSQTASIVKPLLTTFLALNRFPRMTFLKYKKDIFVPSLLTILHGLPISFRVKTKGLSMAQMLLHNQGPIYFLTLFVSTLSFFHPSAATQVCLLLLKHRRIWRPMTTVVAIPQVSVLHASPYHSTVCSNVLYSMRLILSILLKCK